MICDNKKKLQVKTIYVDVLCIESAFKIVSSDYNNFSHIHYCQKSGLGLGKIIILILEAITRANVVQLSNVCLADTFKDGINAYERTQNKLCDILNRISDTWINKKFIQEEISTNRLNKYKVRSYLEQKAYPYLYRSIELLSIAESNGSSKYAVFLVKTPLAVYVEKEFPGMCLFYKNQISKYFPVEKRNSYFYDNINSAAYKRVGSGTRKIIFLQWFYYLLRTIASLLCVAKSKRYVNYEPNSNVGVEQVSLYVRKNECHDLFWMRGSDINPKNVINIEDNEQDEDSIKVLREYGVRRVRVNPSLRLLYKFLKNRLAKKETDSVSLIFAQFIFFHSDAVLRIFSKKYFINNEEEIWLANELRFYCWRSYYWKDIYSQLGVRILWSMRDVAEDSLCRAQAIELLNGYYTGSHWSLYPIDSITGQKMYDIYFIWGAYFSKELFRRTRVTGNHYMNSGYPADFYFTDYLKQAQTLRNKYKDKFVITYIDNNSGNDFQLSPIMQYEMMSFFIELLVTNDKVQLLYKPKRKHELDILIKDIPEMNQYIKQGRIVVYIAEEHGRRVAPVLLGMASNLVVGLGINTAAAECYFSGAEVIHANLARFKGGSFISAGNDVFIFDDITKVKNKIISKLFDNKEFHENIVAQIEEIYLKLDPYKDGRSYIRIGMVLNELLKALNTGLSRAEVDTHLAGFISKIENKDTFFQINS